MNSDDWKDARPDDVMAFWFPDDGHWQDLDRHGDFWMWRMRGKADGDIVERFSDLAEAAARGFLDHWASTPRGRMALIIALDQFSRSVWRGTAGAFGQDIKSCGLVLEAFDNGHYDALEHVWQKQFCLISVVHCEGPDLLARIDHVTKLGDALIEEAPEILRPLYTGASSQPRLVRTVIERFGRHPHRNGDLGRISTPAELAYVAEGKFPHNRTAEDFQKDM